MDSALAVMYWAQLGTPFYLRLYVWLCMLQGLGGVSREELSSCHLVLHAEHDEGVGIGTVRER